MGFSVGLKRFSWRYRIDMQSSVPASFNPWEFGLSVGVIVVLVGAIKVLFDKYSTSTKEQQESYQQSLKELSSQHKSERDEWRQDANKREDRIVNVCDQLIKTIHNHENQ